MPIPTSLLSPQTLEMTTAFSAPTPSSSSFLSRNPLDAKTSSLTGRLSVSSKPHHHHRSNKNTIAATLAAVPESVNAVFDPPSDESWEGLRELFPFSVLRNLHKAGQYLGNEHGAIKKDWDSVEVRMCLAFPDLYTIGMSSTGHVVLYSCINDDPALLCDRAYLPEPDMEDALTTYNKDLFAVESKRSLNDFHVLGMSLMYELCATNCLKMMQLANIPYTWKERDAASHTGRFRDGPPLIFAGGLTVTANPEPYADFFDFMSIGDGEKMLPEIGRVVADVLRETPDISREGVLLALAQRISGVYVPRFYESIPGRGVRRIRSDVPAKVQKQNCLPEPWRATKLVPLNEAVHTRLSVEVRRGCTRSCRFCLPGNVQRPARDVPPEAVVETVRAGLEDTGFSEFSLLSLSCSDWLSLPSVGIQLKNEFQSQNIALSLGSQRVDRFDENIANLVGGVRKSGLTFAPEAGTQRMRDVINKGLTNEDLLRGVRTAYDRGYMNVKLYFMIGLPAETDDDVLAIASTVKWLQRKCRAKGKKMMGFNITISNFTPKPFTPFQWATSSKEDLERKQKLLKKAFQYIRFVKVNYTDTRISSIENFCGRGDRRLGQVILRAHQYGAGMDSWWQSMDTAYEAWTRAIEESGLGWDYRKTRGGEWNLEETEREDIRGKRGWYDEAKEKDLDRKTLQPKLDTNTVSDTGDSSKTSPLDRPLPWDHIDVGLDKGWLRDELFRALAGNLTPDCAFDECSQCGVCGDELGNNVVIPPQPIPEFVGDAYPNCDQVQKIRVSLRKTGSAALASHLDTSSSIDRAVRRAGLPISYNGGFHPYPRISTASALAFGATASNEPYDFILTERMELDSFRKQLEETLSTGLEVNSVANIALKEPTLNSVVDSAKYAVAVTLDNDNSDSNSGGGGINWAEFLEKVEKSGPVIVEKKSKKGKVGKRDLRSMLISLDIANDAHTEIHPVLEHVGVNTWPKDAIVLTAHVSCSSSGALSPDALIRLLNVVADSSRSTDSKSKATFELLHVHRIALYDSQKRKLTNAATSAGSVQEVDRVKHQWTPPRLARKMRLSK